MAGRVSSPEFVGRALELSLVAEALDGAALGDPAHVLIAGEAGIGKTRLATEAGRLARDRGFRLLRGEAAYVGASGLPYGPLVEALRGVATELDAAELGATAGPAAADLERLVPGLIPGAPPPPSQAEWVQTRLFEALLGFLRRLAARTPVLLVLEDLHWADESTRETLTFLLRSLRADRVLVIATYRSDELHRRHPLLPWLAEIERSGRAHRIELARFGRAEMVALLAGILGEPPASTLVDEVFDRSDGNPFFAEELLAAHAGGARLPPTLRDILLARLASVPETAMPVLGVAAVAGRRVEHELLARVAALPDTTLTDGLRAAVAAQLLVVEHALGADGYAFRHALVREVVYDELLPGDRRRLHRALAEALAERGSAAAASDAGYWAELGHHWAAAHEDRAAFEASLRAADAAGSSYAFAAALAAYERALELWDGLPDAAEIAGFDRTELRRRAGLAAYLVADYRRAVAHRRAAAAEVDAGLDPVRAGILQEELGRAYWVSGEAGAALGAYRSAVDIIPEEPPTPERARAISGLGQVLMLQAQYEESRVRCEEAIAIARAIGAPAQEGHALSSLTMALSARGACDEALAAIREAMRLVRAAGDTGEIGRAYVNLGEVLDECGLTVEAVEAVEDGLRVAEELGIGHSYGHYIRVNGVSYLYSLGRWSEALRLLEAATAHPTVGSGADIYRNSKSLQLLVGSGRFEQADPAIRWSLEFVAGVVDGQYNGPVHAAAAERELWRSAPDAALDLVERGLARLAMTDDRLETAELAVVGGWAAGDMAELARAARDAAGAVAARERLGAIRSRFDAVTAEAGGRQGERFAAGRAHLDAEADRVEGRSDRVQWKAIAEAWVGVGRPYLGVVALWRAGQAALAAGDRPAAADALRSAHAVAASLGAAPLRDAVEALARQGRLALASAADARGVSVEPEAADPFGLTARERDVLALVAQGRTNRQIAETLYISESTAGVHVSNIIGKLGVANRVEAASLAYRLHLVPERSEPATA